MQYQDQDQVDEQKKKTILRRYERNLLMMEMDFKKNEGRKETLQMEKRQMDTEMKRLRIELEEKNLELEKIEKERFSQEGEIARIKRKIADLKRP